MEENVLSINEIKQQYESKLKTKSKVNTALLFKVANLKT